MQSRWLAGSLPDKLTKPYVHVLFGARQTGKTTLLRALLPEPSLYFNLADPLERSRLLADAGAFSRACQALPLQKSAHYVVVDEAQTVPAVFDAVQSLYDADKRRWRFVLCGSSARKLRQTGANLLPGRSLQHRLFPLLLAERPAPDPRPRGAASPFPMPVTEVLTDPFPAAPLLERLAYGELPGVALAPEADRPDLLRSYALAHLEEEIRREALIKDWGAFLRFLQLAAIESGQVVNFARIAKDVGISPVTVKGHYQLLEDMFIGFSVPGFSRSPRKNLTSTPRFHFFDLGVRHAAAGLTPGLDAVRADPGRALEQWVGIELWKRIGYLGRGRLHHLRSKDGAEVDFVVELDGQYTPIEVKWTERPDRNDARHVCAFLAEQKNATSLGYVICRVPRPEQLDERVIALPWHCL
ncbi:MAG: ATP-binding protein [Opitutae bacterium]|nr:ATP-binding protein [Opitutae bacterium]